MEIVYVYTKKRKEFGRHTGHFADRDARVEIFVCKSRTSDKAALRLLAGPVRARLKASASHRRHRPAATNWGSIRTHSSRLQRRKGRKSRKNRVFSSPHGRPESL